MKFELPKELSSIIKVIGVGGGGSNAVNHMFAQGINGVDFIVCNTDRQALDLSPVPVKIQLGPSLTEGLGAGSLPEKGKDAAQENLDEIRQVLSNRTKMLFITAGMGGGTGTGAGPVVAGIARELGVLTVGIVTMPFQWEGPKRKKQALAGMEELRNVVDTLLVINNDRLREQYGNLSLDNAFAHADDVLATAARGIVDIITKTGKVNVDFEDVKTVMTRSGVAIMGMAEVEGEDRALRAAQEALDSPLLNDNDIRGAKFVLFNVEHGVNEISLDEIEEITRHIQSAAGEDADVIFGYGRDESLGSKLRLTVIATGFDARPDTGGGRTTLSQRTVIPLDADVPTMITQPIANPVTGAAAPAAPAPPPAADEPYIVVKEQAAPVAEAKPPADGMPPKAEPITQRTIEFEVEPLAPRILTPEPPAEKLVHGLYDESEEGVTALPPAVPPVTAAQRSATQPHEAEIHDARPAAADQAVRSEERLNQMREVHLRMRSPNGVADMEREPAYIRRRMQLHEGPKSTDSSISRFSLNETVDEGGERRITLSKNNPHLHDRVD
ncbi:MAG: cell division protein FtsZ [Flavobacteriales bacterium]|jgi:cell division protein FtsZ|nr:cell division protein FtsZ [Flavobacteriales bacterium]